MIYKKLPLYRTTDMGGVLLWQFLRSHRQKVGLASIAVTGTETVSHLPADKGDSEVSVLNLRLQKLSQTYCVKVFEKGVWGENFFQKVFSPAFPHYS